MILEACDVELQLVTTFEKNLCSISSFLSLIGMWSASFYLAYFIGPTFGGILVEYYGFRYTTNICSALLIVMILIDFFDLKMSIRKSNVKDSGYKKLDNNCDESKELLKDNANVWSYQCICMLGENNLIFIKSCHKYFRKVYWNILRVFICICPNIVRGILVTMWRYFSSLLVFPAQILTHNWRAKAKICSTFAFEFFSNFGHFSSLFNQVFYFHFKNMNIFKFEPKLTYLQCFFHRTIFLAEEFLLF